MNYVEIALPSSQFLNYVVKVTKIKDTMAITVKTFKPFKVTTIKDTMPITVKTFELKKATYVSLSMRNLK